MWSDEAQEEVKEMDEEAQIHRELVKKELSDNQVTDHSCCFHQLEVLDSIATILCPKPSIIIVLIITTTKYFYLYNNSGTLI